MEFARLPSCVQIFVLVCSYLMMDVHVWYLLGPKEILSNNTYILQIYIYIYNALGFNAHIYSFKVKIYVIYHNISSNHWGKFYLTAEKTATGTSSYKVQTYKTRTNLHLTSLNLLNSADKPTPTTNFKRWKYEISLGYKIKIDWKSEGSGSTKMDIKLCFFKFSHQAQKHPSTKLGFIYVEKKQSI